MYRHNYNHVYIGTKGPVGHGPFPHFYSFMEASVLVKKIRELLATTDNPLMIDLCIKLYNESSIAEQSM